MKLYFVIATVITIAAAQQYTTPVPILKQINKHNEDGSYSYGYEAADGTFKIETKYSNGEVFGKYGYIDDGGKLREVEYGASRRGFEPAGNEIQVPPPTLKVNENAIARPLAPNQEDDGQYREDPAAYYKDDPYYEDTRQSSVPQSRYTNYQQSSFPEPAYQEPARPTYTRPTYQPSRYQQPTYQQPAYQPTYQPSYQPPPPPPQPAFRPQPQYNYAPSPPRYYNPAPPAFPNYNSFQGHPATNVDINSGSYSVNYRR